MHVVQVFIPLKAKDGVPFGKSLFTDLRCELASEFGGVTAFMRSPAVGLWQDDDGDLCRDDVVLFEVMAERVDRPWWRSYRTELERRFSQDEILVRASVVDQL
jgi:hypothetical protein